MTAAPIPVEVKARRVAALGLAGLDFDVLSLWSTCPDGTCRCPKGAACDQKPGKHPIASNGTWQETRDPARIRTMLSAGSQPNYGVIPPTGCFAWDVDGAVGPMLDELAAKHGPLPATYGHQTPNGEHRFYRWPARIERPAGGNLFGIITRWPNGDKGRGYVVGPYSQIGVAMYRPIGDPHHIAELPEAWAQAAQKRDRQARPAIASIETGGRHPELRDAARYLHGRGFSGAALRAAIDAINAELPEPKDVAAVTRAIGNVEQFPVDPPDITIAGLSNPATIGTRTALDLRHGPPPDQLGEPYLTPEGVTCLYGRGGVGKGVTACWLALRLVRSGHVVMVLDFEGHEREWGSRLRGLGATDAELASIHYRAPFGADWTADKGALSKVAALVRGDVERLGVTYIVVDSYSVATSNGDTMGGEAAAREFFTGMTTIGTPSLVIAHVAGASGKFPDRPFGSVFVHNLSRETWAVEPLGDDDDDSDPDVIRFGPHVVALELRNRKSNGRPKAAAQFVTFSFFGDGTIEVVTDRPSGRTVADLAADVLTDGPLTLAKIAAAIKEDSGQAIDETTLRRSLTRHPRRFEQSTSGRPRTWSLR